MESSLQKSNVLPDGWWPILLAACIAVNFFGLLVPIIEPDGALYATLAKTMVQSGNYIDLIYNGKDWLDKPHFQFWMTAIGFHATGVSTLGYKIPALLFWLMSLFYTYQLARVFYPRTVARLAVLILATALHGIISNTDVRAEPYLMGLVIGAVFHLFKLSRRLNWFDLMLGSLMTACAIMTKGIFLVIVIASGLLVHAMIKKRWSLVFNLKWLVVVVLVVIFVSPELISLYKQFDLHPEKTVFGQQHVSGLRFFLWDSQFGRFYNTGPIKGEGDPFFFLHTALWSFFPWSIVFFVAAIRAATIKFKEQKEYITLGAVVVTFLLFSMSKFQLPHYLNIVFPFMSILCGHYLCEWSPKSTPKVWSYVFNGQAILAFAVMTILIIYFRPSPWGISAFWIFASGIVLFVSSRKLDSFPAAIVRNIMSSLMLYGFISFFVLPEMATYQSGHQAATYFHENRGEEPFMLADDISFSFDFYCPGEVRHVSLDELRRRQKATHLFCNERFLPVLQKEGFTITTVKTFPHFHITEPRWPFINHETRPQSVEHYLLVKII
ncbi:MAG: glycosyltransferase family 39 protein [Bacteroidetes bacterium]|nr:glycosyltransferase family 39 protein [Bacteroidota bacterium]